LAINQKFYQTQPFTLNGAGISIGATSITLSSMLDIQGNAVMMTSFGTKGYGTLDPGNGAQEEQISFTGITQNGDGSATLTGVSTVLFNYPYTETSGTTKTHIGGAVFVISNTAGFYNQFATTANDETITSLYTFNILPQSTATPSNSKDFATKTYVDATVASGASNASTTVKGIVQEATQAQTDAKTAAGSTGAELYLNPQTARSTLLSDYVGDTGAANAYVITASPAATAYTTGQRFTFKAANANTGASTINVNGLGVKNITKNFNTALVANDILASQIVEIEYDGTEFQLMSPVGNNAQLAGNISTDPLFGGSTTSDTLYPSQKAVRTALDTTVYAVANFETLARYTKTLVAGGTVTFGTSGIVLATSNTTTSGADIQWSPTTTNANNDITAGNPVFSTSILCNVQGTSGSSFFGIGYLAGAGSGVVYTVKHIGFKVLYTAGPTATLYATQGDGSTENASASLTTIIVNDSVDLAFVVNGTSSVDYYWRKNGGAWSAATNLTSNIAIAISNGVISFSISNNSTTQSNSISVYTASYKR
jgi:hypothetical protein